MISSEPVFCLECSVCKDGFSLVPTSEKAPVGILCGHFVCVGCVKKLVTIEDQTHKYSCVICKTTLKFGKSTAPIKLGAALGIIDLISAIKTNFTFEGTCEKKACKICREMHPFIVKRVQDLKGMECEQCEQILSSSVSDDRAPVQTACGHFHCCECVKKMGSVSFDKLTYSCSKCNIQLTLPADKLICHGFMAFLAEIVKRARPRQSDVCSSKCAECSANISVDKARVCLPCFIAKNVGQICSDCAFDNHSIVSNSKHKVVAVKNVKITDIIPEISGRFNDGSWKKQHEVAIQKCQKSINNKMELIKRNSNGQQLLDSVRMFITFVDQICAVNAEIIDQLLKLEEIAALIDRVDVKTGVKFGGTLKKKIVPKPQLPAATFAGTKKDVSTKSMRSTKSTSAVATRASM